MFCYEGRPLMRDGHYAAFRQSTRNDLRSNISAGGEAVAVEVTDEMLKLVTWSGPSRSRRHFFVGLDIVGEESMEINSSAPVGWEVARTSTVRISPRQSKD